VSSDPLGACERPSGGVMGERTEAIVWEAEQWASLDSAERGFFSRGLTGAAAL